jgi:hypothetical protein
MNKCVDKENDLLLFLYRYGGGAPIKIVVDNLCKRWGIDTAAKNHLVRSTRTALCIKGLVKPGVRKSTDHMTISELAEVKNKVRSPYGWWELTEAGKRFVKSTLLS